ncbi:hypothetical protein [Aestuariivirga sp.]|uniref:hypothetical protein n=1 Tax=Aestuariivirga sp. TaxID=2650926 RepID=UPI00391C2C75
MAAQPTLFIISSDRARTGKTLLARALVDFLLTEERDPFCFDLAYPEGGLRAYFPGRTALINFPQEEARRKLFGIVLTRTGRDYVIDLPARHLASFCEAAVSAGFFAAARDKGFRIAIIFLVGRDEKSLRTALDVVEILLPDIFVPAANRFVGSALPPGIAGPVLTLEKLDPDLFAIVSNRRFSLRLFMLGDETAVPLRLRPHLKTFLAVLASGYRELEPALSVTRLRRGQG